MLRLPFFHQAKPLSTIVPYVDAGRLLNHSSQPSHVAGLLSFVSRHRHRRVGVKQAKASIELVLARCLQNALRLEATALIVRCTCIVRGCPSARQMQKRGSNRRRTHKANILAHKKAISQPVNHRVEQRQRTQRFEDYLSKIRRIATEPPSQARRDSK